MVSAVVVSGDEQFGFSVVPELRFNTGSAVKITRLVVVCLCFAFVFFCFIVFGAHCGFA